MNPPPRLAHMLSLPLLVDLLVSPYAEAHNCLDEEVRDDVKRGLADAHLQNGLRAAIWSALHAARAGIEDAALLDQLAKAMSKGSRTTPTPSRTLDEMSSLFASIDVKVGRASDTIRAMLDSTQGRALVDQSLAAAGEFLAGKLFPVKTPRVAKA